MFFASGKEKLSQSNEASFVWREERCWITEEKFLIKKGRKKKINGRINFSSLLTFLIYWQIDEQQHYCYSACVCLKDRTQGKDAINIILQFYKFMLCYFIIV